MEDAIDKIDENYNEEKGIAEELIDPEALKFAKIKAKK